MYEAFLFSLFSKHQKITNAFYLESVVICPIIVHIADGAICLYTEIVTNLKHRAPRNCKVRVTSQFQDGGPNPSHT